MEIRQVISRKKPPKFGAKVRYAGETWRVGKVTATGGRGWLVNLEHPFREAPVPKPKKPNVAPAKGPKRLWKRFARWIHRIF